MASGAYSYGGGGNHAQQQPYYDPEFAHPSSQSTPAPPYGASQGGHEYSHGSAQKHNQPGRPSPFDSVFDDNAYPSGSRHNTPGGGTPQPGYYGDTGYYGQGASPAASRPNLNDDIPLQDRTAKDGDMNDHVYDANAPKPGGKRRGNIRVGELGMIGAGTKRIPFVVYLFSVIQAAVFIAEIVKNGTPSNPLCAASLVADLLSRNLHGLPHHD